MPLDLSDHSTALTDVELLSMIALRRRPFHYEHWSLSGTTATKTALRFMFDYHWRNTLKPVLIYEALDVVVANDESLVRRAYAVALKREPTEAEIISHCSPSGISLARLASKLLYSYESFTVDGLTENRSEPDFHTLRQVTLNWQIQDLFTSSILDFDASQRRAREKLAKLETTAKVRIAIGLPGITKQQFAAIEQALAAEFGRESELFVMSRDDVLAGALNDVSVYLTTNNSLHVSNDAQLQAVADASAFTVCWTWDNHHTYNHTIGIANAFDMIFPAHSNGQTYLQGRRAVVGPIVPCCTAQWSEDDARFVEEALQHQPSDSLYGRFNGYPGRISLRDVFIDEVSRSLSSAVVSIPSNDNRWSNMAVGDRVREVASYKAILCNPIYNDVPCRLFDALFVGSIPVVPYGLPDLHQSFSEDEIESLPVVQYERENIDSLQRAVAWAVARFDADGLDGRKARHRHAASRHLMSHRTHRMLRHVMRLHRVL